MTNLNKEYKKETLLTALYKVIYRGKFYNYRNLGTRKCYSYKIRNWHFHKNEIDADLPINY